MPSLNQLTGWNDNHGPYESRLVECCEKALMKSQEDVSPSEVTALIRSSIALKQSVQIAMRFLRENPTTCARNYEGDLFATVLQLPSSFWFKNPELWADVNDVLAEFERASEIIYEHKESFRSGIYEEHSP